MMTTDAPDINFDDTGDRLPKSRLMVLRDTAHAYHKLGDIGRPESDRVEFITVGSEKPGFLVGNFIEGFGFINVHFPRKACSPPTNEEQEWLSGRRLGIGPFPARGASRRNE